RRCGFNEAAVRDGGSRAGREGGARARGASMRPPFVTAEVRIADVGGVMAKGASMRPPFVTAEVRASGTERGPASFIASMRPPFVTAEVTGRGSEPIRFDELQ